MSHWIVLFSDTPAMLRHRKKHGAAHIDYLKANADAIITGGGFRAAPDAPFEGGMWIVNQLLSYDAVVDLVMNDPYYHPEARRFQIKFWGKAIDAPVTV